MAQASQISLEVVASSTETGETHVGYVRVNEQLSSGTDADEADLCYRERLTIANASSPTQLDLGDGSLIDINGDALVMREVVSVLIQGLTDANDEEQELVVDFDFGGGDYTWTEPVIAGGSIAKHAPAANGYPTTGAGPHITITPLAGTNVTVDVVIVGRSLS